LKSKGLQILEDIEVHISTNNCNCHHPSLKDLVFGGRLNGTTPLLLACHYGDVDWVKRIIERWGVSVNATGTYFFYPLNPRHDPEIARATPLFVAASNGHAYIVKFLVGKGADVSSKTSSENFFDYYDGMTPLYGALINQPYDRIAEVSGIVRVLLEAKANPNDVSTHRPPIWMTEMCGVDATIALIRHGLDLNQLNSNSETVLQHWVNIQSNQFDSNRQRDSPAVVQLLVEKGANFMAQDNNGFTSILQAVKSQNFSCVDYFLEKEGVDQMEKINAMEMAAAIILSNDSEPYYHLEFERAFGYWRRALHLRLMEPHLVQKTPLGLKSGQAGEWITSDQLEKVIEHPLEYKTQSYLVRLRICSERSRGAVLDLLHDSSFSNCLEDLTEQGRLVDLLDVLWATLEIIHRFDHESDYELCSMTDYVVEQIIWMLSQLERDDPLLAAETFILPLEVMVAVNQFFSSDDDSDTPDSDIIDSYSRYTDSDDGYDADQHPRSLLQFVAFLAGLPHEILTPEIRQSLRQLVLQNSLGERGRTLLHMACEHCKAKDLPTIRLLLLSRANPNAGDEIGNLPLHTLAYQHGNDAVIQSAAHFLMEYGAQLESANDYGETAADVWIRSHEPEAGFNVPPEWCFKPVTVPNLDSLCARIVRSQGIPYDELQLPATLIALVELRELGG